MLDIKFIRENPELIKDAAEKKNISFDVAELLKCDELRLEKLSLFESLRAEQNAVSDKIPSATPEDRADLIAKMTLLKEDLKKREEELAEVMKDWQKLMLFVPNIPDPSAPVGKDESENVIVETWGEKTKFDFEPKDHIEIMTKLGMVDFERGTKVHGFRGYYLIGDGAMLCFAIWRYALDFFTKKNFSLVIPPVIVRKQNLYITGHLPGDAEDYYLTQDGDALAGTAEVPIMGMHAEEVFASTDLPKRYLGFSPCFRREAGSYSKDVKGLIRVHEFFKFEQVILCEANHATSVQLHEELNRNTEEFIESLNIPYHTVVNCTGDLGLGQVKKYDIELWVPKEGKYREISSASYFHDFQTRRANIRYRDAEGVMRYTHSLNSTAIPTPRILVSLIENYQEADGRIRIPDVLRPYFGKDYIG